MTTWVYEETQDLAHLERRMGEGPQDTGFQRKISQVGRDPIKPLRAWLHLDTKQCSEA